MKRLPFARPDLTEEEYLAVRETMQGGWITSGPQCDLFEEEFKNFVQAKHAVALNSATAALHLSLLASNLQANQAILVPSITFTATAEIVNRSGAYPLIVDVDRQSYLLEAHTVEKFIQDHCKLQDGAVIHNSGKTVQAIITVHYGGRPSDIAELQKLCDKYNLLLLQDAAHCLPGSVNGKPIGATGAGVAFSFYATKNMTTGEGGMLTTNSEDIARVARVLRLHGIETPAHRRSGWEYDVISQGYKYNMSDIQAAIGRVQLRRANQMHERRKLIHELYQKEFANLPGLSLCPESIFESAHHLYTVEIDAGIEKRNLFNDYLNQDGIGTGLHFIPLYRMTYYKEQLNLDTINFPESESIFSRILSLPIYSAMTDDDIERVIESVKKAALKIYS